MKKIVLALALLGLSMASGAGFLYWRAMSGVPADQVEDAYMTPADRFVDVAGARVRVREEGAADAPVVLLIHGFSHSLETWDGWASELKKTHRVVRYDLLGHGLTGPDAQERYSPEERAAFVGDVLDALGADHAIIAGNSLGGLAAWRFAAENPERVDALILVSPGAYQLNGVKDTPAEIPAAMKAYLMTAPEAGVRASAELIYGDDGKITDSRVATMRDMIRREGNGAAMIKSLEEFTLPDPTQDLARIAAPTLILWGEDDIVIAVEQGRRIEETVSDARMITFPGVGHAAQEEAPAETVAEAIAFIDSVAAPMMDDAE